MKKLECDWIIRILDVYDKVQKEKMAVGEKGVDNNV